MAIRKLSRTFCVAVSLAAIAFIALLPGVAAPGAVVGRAMVRPSLSGEWRRVMREGSSGAKSDRIVIQQIGQKIVATQVSDGVPAEAGDMVFSGSYTADPFVIQRSCAEQGEQNAETRPAKLSVLDATHILIRGGCGGLTTWERTGPMTLVIDAEDLFEFNSANLKPDARPLLNDLSEMLHAQAAKAHISVCGYTDNLGTWGHNLQLSTRRARSLANWLEDHRTSALHIQAKGFGEQNPRYPNTTDKGRSHNRRIEIEIEPRTPSKTAR